MSRVPGGRRVIAGLLASSLLMGLAVMPGSPFHTSEVAAAGSSDCSVAEGSYTGFYNCTLDVVLDPAICDEGCSVPAGVAFTTHVFVKNADNTTRVTTGCASTSVITLKLFQAEGEGFVEVRSLTKTAVGGDAKFTLSVALPGPSFFRATAVVPTGCLNVFNGPSDSQSFDVVCPSNCSDTIISDGGTTAFVELAGGGTFDPGFPNFSDLTGAGIGSPCKNGVPTDPTGVLNISVSGGTKTIITLVVAGNAPLPVCWHSPVVFKQADGKLANADLSGGFTGLLPTCKANSPVGPCVLSQSPQGPKPVPQTVIKILDSNCAGCSGGYISRK